MAYAEMAALVRLVGTDVALEILLEGRIFDAAEAMSKGLVTRVVAGRRTWRAKSRQPPAHCRRRAPRRPLAQEIRAPAGRSCPLSAGEADEGFACFDTDDFRVGYAAFLAKRKPEFTGK